MSSVSRSAEYLRLEQELEQEPFRQLLHELQRDNPFLREFRSWHDLVQFMHSGRTDDPGKNEVLELILEICGESHYHHLQTVLIAIMWPALNAIARRFWRWIPEDADRWAGTYWAFVQTISEWDAGSARRAVATELVYETRQRYRNELRRETRRQKCHEAKGLLCGKPGDDDSSDPDIDVEDPKPWADEVEGRLDQETQLRFLRQLWQAGYLSEPNYHILVGRHIYGQSLQEYAEAAGLTWETAKRRRSRADEALRTAVKKSSESLSPPAGSHGLFLVETPHDKRGPRRREA